MFAADAEQQGVAAPLADEAVTLAWNYMLLLHRDERISFTEC